MKSRSRNQLFLLLDIVLTATMLSVMSVAFTGIAIHEWLGIAFIAVLVLHLLLHWQWIVNSTWRWLTSLSRQMRLTYIVDVLLFIAMVLAIFSGLVISEVALPYLGLISTRNFAWRGIHSMSSNGTLLLIGVHLAINWRWIVSVIQRMFSGGVKQPASVKVLGSSAQL